MNPLSRRLSRWNETPVEGTSVYIHDYCRRNWHKEREGKTSLGTGFNPTLREAVCRGILANESLAYSKNERQSLL
jgi:hypothetical protein